MDLNIFVSARTRVTKQLRADRNAAVVTVVASENILGSVEAKIFYFRVIGDRVIGRL